MGSRDVEIGDKERQAERVRLDEAVRLRPNDWSSLEVQMIDVSTLGFKASCDARLRQGGCVSLEIPGLGPVEAVVEWQRDDIFGASFLQPIDMDRCTWKPAERESALAQLLIERAAARRAGRVTAERGIRQRILGALPVHKNRAQA